MKKFIIGMFFLINSSSLYSTDFITLGTGEVNATYYPRGLFLCKLINEFQTENKIRCSVESTDGSVYNINAIDKGELNFAISQSDTVYNAVNGKKNFLNNEKEKIRSVISIYPELLTFIVSKKSGIKSIEDIEGKRINIGNPLSGSRVSTLKLFEKYGIKKEKLSLAGGLKIEDTADALRDDKIDGYFFMVGHPSQNIKDAVDSIPVSIIPLAGDKVNQLVEENPYFSKAYIPSNSYSGINSAVETFGVKAVLITSENVKSELVYNFVKIIMENFDKLKKSHSVYGDITKESLLEGLSAPQHGGAIKYFKEINLLEKGK